MSQQNNMQIIKLPIPSDQSGAVLAAGLIFLLVITVLGVSGVQNSSLEERMTANIRDRNLSFQAAEAALRDAEAFIDALENFDDFKADCTRGLCDSAGAAQWATLTAGGWSSITAKTRAYGTNTKTLPAVDAQPRYMIEWLENDTSNPPVATYLITVRAVGANSNSVVLLQEVYKQKIPGDFEEII